MSRTTNPNTVELGAFWSGAATSMEHLPETADARVEGARLETTRFGVGSAPEAAVAPSPHMITPERVLVGGGRWQERRA